MFGIPERTNEDEVRYYVSVNRTEPMGVKYVVRGNTVVPNLEFQDILLSSKHTILGGLSKHSNLFTKPPTLEYLQAITPNWGCIVQENQTKWSPYTLVRNTIPETQQPCLVDLILTGLYISRSTISPQFETVFLEGLQESKLIDIEWAPNPISPEVEEISEIILPSAGSIELRDPAILEQMKLQAKMAVKEAFQRATQARDEAMEKAKQFTNEFDVSDNESMFSEWLVEDEEEAK